MLRPLFSRLGARFSLALLGAILLTATLVATVALERFNHFGQLSTEQNETHILRQYRSALSLLIGERARNYESIFRQAEAEARLLTEAVRETLAQGIQGPDTDATGVTTLRRHPASGIFTNDPGELCSCTYWGSDQLSQEVKRKATALARIDPLIRHAKESVQGASAAWLITNDGFSRYYPNIHHVESKPAPQVQTLRTDGCFRAVSPEDNPGRGIVWNKIHKDALGQGLIVTVSMPVYSRDGLFLGATGIDISLNALMSDMLVGPLVFDKDCYGFSFLSTVGNDIIALPLDRLPMLGLKSPTTLLPGQLLKLNLTDSTLPAVVNAAETLRQEQSGTFSLPLSDETYLVTFHTLPTTQWRLAYAIPEKSMLTSVRQTRTALDQSRLDATNRIFALTLLLLLGSGLLTLMFLMRNLFVPVRRILDVIRRVSHGDMAPRIHLTQKDELAELAEAINDMIERLEAKQTFLTQAEEKYRTLFENATVGLFRTLPNGTILSANKAIALMLGYDSPEQLIGEVTDLAQQVYMTPQDRSAFINKMSSGDTLGVYEFQVRRRDGSIIWVQGSARAIRDAHNEILFFEGSLNDITDRKRAEEYQRILARELIRIQEFERRRVALDLHDNVAQDLSALKIAFETLFDDGRDLPPYMEKRALRCAEILGKSIASVRNMAYDLRPSGLDQIGLVDTLAEYCHNFSMSSGIEVDFFSAGMETVTLDGEAGIHVFRVAQEALSNVRKHGQADKVTVRLIASHPNVILRVEDNGSGFDPTVRPLEALAEKRMGLIGIRERAEMLGGKATIHSVPGKGTRLVMEFPSMPSTRTTSRG